MLQTRTGWRGTCVLAFVLGILLGSRSPSFADEGRAKKIDLPADLALVPSDVAGFASLEIAALWNGGEAAALKKVSEAHPIVILWTVRHLEKTIGLTLAEIKRVVAVVPDFKSMDEGVVILTTVKPYDRKKVSAAVVPNAKEDKIKDKTFFTSEASGFGLHFVNDSTLLLGNPKGVRTFLARPAPAKSGLLESAIRTATEKHFLVAGVNPSSFLGAVKNGDEKGKKFVPLFEAKSWRITVDAVKELRINLRLDFADDKKAKEGQTALQGIGESLVGYFAYLDKGMSDFYKREADKYKGIGELSSRLPNALKNTSAALKEFKNERKGSTVQGTVRIKTDEPVTTFVLLLSMMPRAAKK
jgi:hypothetical protein